MDLEDLLINMELYINKIETLSKILLNCLHNPDEFDHFDYENITEILIEITSNSKKHFEILEKELKPLQILSNTLALKN